MIFDLIVYGALGAGAMYLFLHFRGDLAPKADTDFALLQLRFEQMTQKADDIVARLASLPATLEAKFSTQIADLQGQVTAAQNEAAADLTKIDDAITNLVPPPPAA